MVLVSQEFNYILFADDTNLISHQPDATSSELLKIQEWCHANQLIVNYSKTCQVTFKNHQKKINESNFTVLNLEILSKSKIFWHHYRQASKFCYSYKFYNWNIQCSFNDALLKEISEPKKDGKFILLFYISTPHLRGGVLGACARLCIRTDFNMSKKVLRIICCRPPNSSITN